MLSSQDQKRLTAYIGFALRSGSVVKGSDACIRYVRSSKLDCVLLNEHSSDNTKSMLIDSCKFYKIPYYILNNNIFDELFSTNLKVIGLKKSNLSNSIIKLLNSSQGEN